MSARYVWLAAKMGIAPPDLGRMRPGLFLDLLALQAAAKGTGKKPSPEDEDF